MDKAMSLLWWLLVIFIIYAIFTSPERTGDIFRALLDVIVSAFRGLGVFFESVLDGQ